MFKNEDDFGGYWLKGVKTYKGHGGEPLFQGNVYFKNKNEGAFSKKW